MAEGTIPEAHEPVDGDVPRVDPAPAAAPLGGREDDQAARVRTWQPTRRRGRAHIGLHPVQRIGFSLIGSGLALAVTGAILLSSLRLLVLVPLAALIVVAPWLLFARVGVDLGRRSARVVGYRPRVRIVDRNDIEAFVIDEDGRVAIVLKSGGRVQVWAPRRTDGLFDDGDVDAKLAYFNNWVTEPDTVAASGTAPGPTAAATGEPVDAATVARFPLATLVSLFVLATVVGYLFVGRDVLVLAVAMLALLGFARDPGRPLALASFLLLVIAALATIIQDFPPTLIITYANRRPTAAEAGAIVGLFLVLSTAIFAVTERSQIAAPARRVVRRLTGGQRRAVLHSVPAWIRQVTPYVIIAVVALVVRKAGSPAALADAYRPLLDNLRLGTDYSLRSPSGGTIAASFPPLAPSMVAYFPLGPAMGLLLISLATVVATGWVAHQRGGRAAAIPAAAIAAVMPALWAPQMPVQMAALFVVLAVGLVDPAAWTSTRAFLAGGCLGLAFLARPESLLAVPVVVLWPILVERRRATMAVPVRAGRLTATAVGLVLVAAPWINIVWSNGGGPWPTDSLATTLNDPTAVTRLPSIVMVGCGLAVLATALLAMRAQWERRFDLLPMFVLPVVTTALSLTDPLRRDPLSWSAPVVAVLLGTWLGAGAQQRWPAVFAPVAVGSFEDVIAPPPAEAPASADAGEPADGVLV